MSTTDKAGTTKGRKNWAGRKAAQRAMPRKPGQKCQVSGCNNPATQRQHKDGNTSNNSPDNLMWVCQTHMAKQDKAAGRWGWDGKDK